MTSTWAITLGLGQSTLKWTPRTERRHPHGYGISVEVLRRDLRLRVLDFGDDQELEGIIKGYYSLIDDYMMKRGDTGLLHTPGTYVLFMREV